MASSPLFLTSRLLEAQGIAHGFSIRAGGVSAPPFDALNLSAAVGDDPDAVRENHRRLEAAAGLDRPVAVARQVHGDRILGCAGDAARHEIFAASDPGGASGETGAGGEPADALVALAPGATVGVRVADCLPILLAARDGRAAAAVHSGWRGTRLRIAGRSVRALQQAAGVDPTEMVAAIGPGIERCCYEVSAELAATFRAAFGAEVADDPARVEKPHLDLRRCAEETLIAAGVPRGSVEHVPGCTFCDPVTFYSHRRDAGRTGRHLAFVVAR